MAFIFVYIPYIFSLVHVTMFRAFESEIAATESDYNKYEIS